MPATTPKKEAIASNGNGAAPRYVKCDLNDVQKEHLKAWADELEWIDLMKWVDSMCSDYRVISIKHMPDVAAFACAVTTVKGSGDEGKTLMARGSTATKALVSAMYRDTVVLGGVWAVVERLVEVDL